MGEAMRPTSQQQESEEQPKLRLGFVHSLRGAPEVHIVEAKPGESLRSILKSLNYPAAQIEVTEFSTTSWFWKSAPRFQLHEKAETVIQKVNPLSGRLSPQAYDDQIVIGRAFVFLRPGDCDPELLKTLGVDQPAIIPRFGMREAGYAALDQRLDPCARKLPTWQPHLNIAPLVGVFGPEMQVCFLAFCQPGSQPLPSRAEVSLRDGGDYRLSGTARKSSVKEGLLLIDWQPNLRQVLSREPVTSGSERGVYQGMIEWGGQEARWSFKVGDFQRPGGKAEWIEAPQFQDRLWSGRIRLRGQDGKALRAGIKVKVVLDYWSVEAITSGEGVVKLVGLQDSLCFPYLYLNWSPKEKWSKEWESRTWDDWQKIGLGETAILPLPRCDVLERAGLRVSLQKFPGSQSVSGLEVGFAPGQPRPLQPVCAVSEQLQLRASQPIQMAAVTVFDCNGGCFNTQLGPLAAGEICEVNLSSVQGNSLYVCLGALYENGIQEVAFPFFRPPTLELNFEGPIQVKAGQKTRLRFRLKSSRSLPGRVLMVVQDARLGCPFEQDLKARKWTDLMMLVEEVEGQPRPLFSQAWLDGTLQLVKKRGEKLPADIGPAHSQPLRSSFLVGPPPTNPDRRWSRMDLNQTVDQEVSSESALATWVKVRWGVAELSWVAPQQPVTLAVQAFALDERGALSSAQGLLTIEPED